MIYEYTCSGCSATFEVIKPLKDFERQEMCPTSGVTMTRAFAPQKLHLYGTAVQDAYFHPALGSVVKGDTEARQIAKNRGLIEVGNERPEKHLKPQLSSYDD